MLKISANEKALQFVAAFNETVAKNKQEINRCNQRISELELELKYVNDVELKEAIEIRILEADNSKEKKVRKLLDKLELELKQLQEELPALQRILEKYISKAGLEAWNLYNLYRDEKQLQEQQAVAHMLHAKKLFTDEIIKQSDIIREVNSVDTILQEVLVATGNKNGVYTYIEIPKSVHLSEKELTGLIRGTENNNYLNNYAKTRNL